MSDAAKAAAESIGSAFGMGQPRGETLYVSSNRSETIGALAAALAKAQGAMEPASKDRKNDFFKSSYADLASCWDVARGPLSANGLAVVQRPGNTDAGISLLTELFHASGEWLSNYLEVPVKERTAQGIGSAITYARRYAFSAMVGISSEDDDGNAASGKDADKRSPAADLAAKKAAAIKEPAPATPWDRINTLCTLAGKAPNDVASFVKGATGKKGRGDLTDDDVRVVAVALEALKKNGPIVDVAPGETEEQAKARVEAKP